MSAKKIAVAKWLTAFFIAACLTLAFGSTYSYADDVDETGSGRSSPVETAATDQSEASVTTTGEVVSATNEESGTTAAEPTATSTSTASGGTAESTTNTDVATASTASETSIATNVASGTTESVEGTSNEEGQVFVGATLKSEEAASATEKDQSAPASTEPESEALKTAASASNVSSVEGSKEAEQKDLTKGKQETTVTLSLPSVEYQTVYDDAFVFDSIEKEILYMVAQGTVEDSIPDEFTLVQDSETPFTMTLAGETLAATADGSNAWNFGAQDPDTGSYPYRVEYYEGQNAFKWFINVPIENAKRVTLSYVLKIDEDADEGDHPTNNSATLTYVTSEGEQGDYEFEIPMVTYTLADYAATKVWNDSDDADGIRPDSVTVQLYADGEAYGDPVTLSADNDWTYSWDRLPMWSVLPVRDSEGELTEEGVDIVYSVKEVSTPSGYTSEITTDENKATITNTHTPTPATTTYTVVKVWDDSDNADKIRPDSVTVQLYADGEAYGDPVTLSDDNDWIYTWTELPALNDEGEDIAYSAQETVVPDGYTASISVDASTNTATITNVHTLEPKPKPEPEPKPVDPTDPPAPTTVAYLKSVVPPTGDSFSLTECGILAAISTLALVSAFATRRRKEAE